jgi:primary-amine oxidase
MEKAVSSGRVFVAAGFICRALASVTLVAACTDGQTDINRNPKTSSTTDAITAVTHPLDPLTPDEINQAVAAVQAAGYGGSNIFIPVVRLQEPSKAFVNSWIPGQVIPRKAHVVVFVDTPPSGVTHELTVALGTTAKVVSDQQVPGVQPSVLNTELGIAFGAPVGDPRFQAGLIARGYGPETWGGLFCAPLSAGNYHVPLEEGRRLFRVTCLDAFSTNNPWSRPIENLTAVVDLVTQQVIEVTDTGIVPQSDSNGDWQTIPQQPPAKPIVVSAPQGDDYTVNGHTLTSPHWNVHFRVESRDGLMIDTVKYNDHGTLRSVLYKANLAETFVPYADTTSNFYFRTYMDEGEYGFGKSSQSMIPGKDCPENATFYDATITDDFGNPFQIPNVVCIFEEKDYLGYHHADIFNGNAELARAPRNIVMRYGALVGNYDYFFEWKFHDDGTISCRIGASGSLETKGLPEHVVQQDHNGDLRWGTLVDSRLGGPNHQHIFDLRLDMDVDGTSNSLVELTPTLVPTNFPDSHRHDGWTPVATEITHEGSIDKNKMATMFVINEHKKNAVGNPVGYEIASDNDITLLMTNDDPQALRGSFTKHTMWVTPNDPTERYIAGEYPFMADGTVDGIQNWVKQNRNVDDTDLVVWVNLGLNHITRSEDWPLMPTEWFGALELRPTNFFSKNPLNDLNDNQ